MKKVSVIVFILSLYSIYLSFCNFAYANSSSYYRIINDKAILYTDSDLSCPLCYLPYSYYVSILDELENSFHIEYSFSKNSPSIDGYIEKSNVKNDNTITDSPFLSLQLKAENTTLLYSDYKTTKQICYVFFGKSVDYIGKAVDSVGKPIYFVCYNSKLGYIKGTDISAFTIPLHSNPIVTENKPTKTDDNDSTIVIPTFENDSGLLALKVIIVACILFAVAIFIFILIDKKKQAKYDNSYYDEGDVER